MSNLKDVCVDCEDAWTLANWWAPVLGYRLRPHTEEDLASLRAQGIERPEDDPYLALDPVDEPGPSIWFLEVPEPKTVKNRVHLDVYAAVDVLLAAGASVVERHPRWTVMADPEGNEFCAFDPATKPAAAPGAT